MINSKKAQIEKFIVVAVVIIVAAVLIIALYVSGLLPKTFTAVMGQLKTPSTP